jgi:HSP20 family molecular chaperone IbpA
MSAFDPKQTRAHSKNCLHLKRQVSLTGAAEVWNLRPLPGVVEVYLSGRFSMVSQKITTATTDNGEAFLELHYLEQNGSSTFVLDAYEVENVIELTAEVPGVQDSDIEVNLEGDMLTISVEKRARSDGKRTHFSERAYGSLQRCIKVPFAPDADSVTAEVENGVLSVRFPRVEPEQTRRIAVRGAHRELGNESRAIGATWDQKPAAENASAQTQVAGAAPRESTDETALTLTDVAGAAPRESAAEKRSTLTSRDWLNAEQT